MLVSHEKRFVYLMPPKCGTKATRLMFERLFKCEYVGLHHGIDMNAYCKLKDDGYRTVISCRNPYSRHVSTWNWLRTKDITKHTGVAQSRIEWDKWVRQGKMSFEDFMQLQATARWASHNIVTSFNLHEGQVRIDYVVRQENMATDLLKLPWMSNERLTRLQHENRSTYPKGSWRQYLIDSPESVQLIRDHDQEDF